MIYKHLIFLLCLCALTVADVSACTSAIIGASRNPSGRTLLWKHRDTSATDNKVEYIAAKNGQHSYVALFNASDKNCEQAWIGMNDAGFAIMNTASYNIKDDNVPESRMDREGFVMTLALKSCRTVDDFARLLDKLPAPFGVEANFGVIDATGDGAFFETNNHAYVRYNLKDTPDDVLIRTNYSHSGRPNEGYGFIREANAECILAPYIAAGSITPEVLTETVSRSFYHDLKKRDYACEPIEKWVIDQDFIPRYKSTATIVIEGCRPVDDASSITPEFVADEYIMWTALGYPPCSEVVPVWCRKGGVDSSLRGLMENGHSEMSDNVKKRRDEVFPYHYGNGDKYIDMTKLINKEGTGYLQTLPPLNRQTYQRISRLRDEHSN